MEARAIQTLNNYMLRELGTLTRVIHSKCDVKYKQYRLQKGQFIFLTRVCENPGINSIELSTLLKVDKTTASKALQKLIRDGYLRKEQDPDDSRAFQLYATEKALQIYDFIIDDENDNIKLCLNGLSETEINEINRLIHKMSANIESAWQGIKHNKRSAENGTQG